MTFLRNIKITPTNRTGFPFIGIVKNIKEISFDSTITIVVGDNGIGKSTLIEALAVATELPVVGSDDVKQDPSLKSARELAENIKLVWNERVRRGFFLRAEDFFGYQKRLQQEMDELRAETQGFSESLEGYGKLLATGAMQGEISELERAYGKDPDAFSHG